MMVLACQPCTEMVTWRTAKETKISMKTDLNQVRLSLPFFFYLYLSLSFIFSNSTYIFLSISLFLPLFYLLSFNILPFKSLLFFSFFKIEAVRLSVRPYKTVSSFCWFRHVRIELSISNFKELLLCFFLEDDHDLDDSEDEVNQSELRYLSFHLCSQLCSLQGWQSESKIWNLESAVFEFFFICSAIL